MTTEQIIENVSGLLNDDKYNLISRKVYELNVLSAFYEYRKWRERKTFEVVEIDSVENDKILITDLLSNFTNGSRILGIELMNNSGRVIRSVYFRPEHYDIIEEDIIGNIYIKLDFQHKGQCRIFYTVPYESVEEISNEDVFYIIYFAASISCLTAKAKMAALSEKIIGADRIDYMRKMREWEELSKHFKELAFNVLELPKDGLKPASITSRVPYLEKQRTVRRT